MCNFPHKIKNVRYLRRFSAVFLFFVISTYFSAIATRGQIYIRTLAHNDPEIKQMRAEVTENLKAVADGQRPEIKWRRYRLTKNDTFFKVMARTVLNHDTISSVNRLASLWDVGSGQEWLLPNVRGIAVYGDKETITRRFSRRAEDLIAVPGKENVYFITGLHFDETEKDFFNLKAFIHPVEGRITSGFGVRRDPFTEKHKFHKGIDIACGIGTKVVASAEGTVVFSDTKKGYGKTIIVEHRNGYRTLYGHLSKLMVKNGDKVKQAQKIALSGMTGRSTGPHLHFEVRRLGQPERPNFHLARI